ncbi:hypothetical protein ACPB8Q_06490 [Methanocaldococcus indicus]|uniref:hypothetical protein n=1 Tax=Methanocaldococcus indicus TaxID=213231 RepID=UPI003C6D4B29
MSIEYGEYRNNCKEKMEKIKTPCYLKIKHKLSLLFSDFEDISYNDFWLMVDNPNKKLPQKKFVITDKFDYRLPIYEINHNPFTPELNKIISEKYHLIEKYVKTQRDIKDYIVDYVNTKTPKTVILYLIDGLSYWDYINASIKYNVEPIFVNGKTTTENGLKNIVYGKNGIPIAKELYKFGYKGYGQTYWNRKNKLTDILFRYISEKNIFYYDENIHDIIVKNKQSKKYIQIYKIGLDDDAHKLREVSKKSIINKIKEIFENINILRDILNQTNQPYLIVITADHGIKWDFTKKYRKGSHGNISFEECFVPLIIIEG